MEWGNGIPEERKVDKRRDVCEWEVSLVRMLSTLVLRKQRTHTGVVFILPSHNKICDTHSDRRGGRFLGFKP